MSIVFNYLISKTSQFAIVDVVTLKTSLSFTLNDIISKTLLESLAKQLFEHQNERLKQKDLNVYFDNILDLKSFNSIVVLKYLDEVFVVQRNRLASSSIFRLVFLFASSILSFFPIKQSMINSFDKLRNDKIGKLNDDKSRKNTLANVDNLHRRKRAFSLKKDSINCRRQFEIN